MTIRSACILLCTPLLLLGSAFGADVHHGATAGQHADHTSPPHPAEVDRLRGLGYIGVMALGAHHQVHHWGMVQGANPHQ